MSYYVLLYCGVVSYGLLLILSFHCVELHGFVSNCVGLCCALCGRVLSCCTLFCFVL